MKLSNVLSVVALTMFSVTSVSMAEPFSIQRWEAPEKVFPGMDLRQIHNRLKEEYGEVEVQLMYDLAKAVSTANKAHITKEASTEELNEFLLADGKRKGYLNLLSRLKELYHYPPFWVYLAGFSKVHKEEPGIIKRSIEAFRMQKGAQ